ESLILNVSTNDLSADFGASSYETNIDNSTIQFIDWSNGATSWFWDFDDASGSSVKNPEYTFDHTGTYLVHLVVTNADNCIDTASKSIIINDIIKDLFTFYIPNSFTPNADGLNDIFFPGGIGWDITAYSLEIYDRWGKKLFHTFDHTQGWNGFVKNNSELAPLDVYTYKVELKDIFNKTHHYTGSVSLIN
ncbi:MAG: gliding motility-associated C-terminal domain-containing protein, partial [Bacteroidia bacterium]